MKDRDIFTVAVIYLLIILVSWACFINSAKNKEIAKLNKELYEAKVIAVELYNSRDNAYFMLDSMNEYAESLEYRISVLENQSQILKDLRSVNNYQLVIALCFFENRFSKTRSHKDKSIIGKQCGIKAYWVDIIPELNYDNINTLKAGELVLDYLLKQNNGDLFQSLKDYKGSDKNLEPVYETLKLYKEIK